MSAAVFANCLFCNKKNLSQNIGTVSTLEGLADFIDQNVNGNFYFDCGKHNSLEIVAQKQSATVEEINIDVPVRIRDRNGRKS